MKGQSNLGICTTCYRWKRGKELRCAIGEKVSGTAISKWKVFRTTWTVLDIKSQEHLQLLLKTRVILESSLSLSTLPSFSPSSTPINVAITAAPKSVYVSPLHLPALSLNQVQIIFCRDYLSLGSRLFHSVSLNICLFLAPNTFSHDHRRLSYFSNHSVPNLILPCPTL